MSILERVIAPVVTPFTDDTASVSEIRLSRVVRFHLDQGCAALLVGSEAGEVFSLSHSERKQVVEWVVRDGHGVPVYVNVSANTTASMIDLAQHADRHGAHAAVATVPAHTPLNALESQAFWNSVRRFSNITVGFVDSDNPNEEGLSILQVRSLEASNLAPIALYKSATTEEFVAEERVATPLAVLGSANARKLVNSWLDRQGDAKALFAHGRSHRVGKAVLIAAGIEVGHTRGPVLDLDPPGQEMLEALLASLG